MRFGKRSRQRLEGVHSDLVIVMSTAIYVTDIDFAVLEGVRTVERQEKLVASGASKTMNSRHLTGHAVDVAPYVDGEIRWDWPLYDKLSVIIKAAADDCGIQLEWGGDWRSFKDGPHWQLPKRLYK